MKKVVTIVLVLTLGLCLFGCVNPEHDEAVAAFESAVASVEAQNEELVAALDSLQTVIDSGEMPLDESLLPDAETAVTTASTVIVEIPEMPGSTEEIQAEAETLTAVDYSEEIIILSEKQIALENSIKQLAQVTNPSEAFIIERLQGIESVVDMAAVTEDNDPNGNLHKQGGYTAAIFFTDSQVNQDDVFGATVIERGTDGGGSIEVYSTVEDAESRDAYLSAFDGSILASGSHHVVGTVLIRTSSKLTATQQTALTDQITASLIELK